MIREQLDRDIMDVEYNNARRELDDSAAINVDNENVYVDEMEDEDDEDDDEEDDIEEIDEQKYKESQNHNHGFDSHAGAGARSASTASAINGKNKILSATADAKNFEELSKYLMKPIPDYPVKDQSHDVWEIKDWSGLKDNKVRGPTFRCGGFVWNILLFPNGNNNNQLALYIEPKPDPEHPDYDPDNEDWYVCAQFGLDIWNPVHSEFHKTSSSFHRFNKNNTDWGFSNFIDLKGLFTTSMLRTPSKGAHSILENNQLNITAYVKVIDDSSTGVLWHSFNNLEYDSKSSAGYVGLNNQGATCYLNSLLQSYFTTKCFRKLVYQIPTEEHNKEKSVPLSLQRIFYQLTNSKDPVATLELTKSFGWDSLDAFTQHDVQELNRILMDKLETAMKGTEIENSLNPIFVGKMKSYIKCVDVEYESSRVEDFWDIQLNVKGFQNLQQAFANYIEVEMLEGENKYQAGDELGYQDAKKGVVFQTFPDVLHLQLKRFEYDFMIDDLVKIDDNFEFPDSIDLSPYLEELVNGLRTDENWNYKLHGVLVHQGSISNGHYYALIKPEAQQSPNSIESGWLRFDDDKVWKVTPGQVFHENFGAHELSNETLLKMTKVEQQEYIMRRSTSAYMLVYYRESKLDTILPAGNELIESAIPEHIPKNIIHEREEKQRLEKAKLEALYYTNIKVATVNNFNHYNSCDLYPDQNNERFYDASLFSKELHPLNFKVKKEDSFKSFYIEVGKKFGLLDESEADDADIDISQLSYRLVTMNHRTNYTNRAFTPVPDQFLEKSVIQVFNECFNRKYEDMSFYVEEKGKELVYVSSNLVVGTDEPKDFKFESVLERLHLTKAMTIPEDFKPTFENSDHIIVFVKYFDPLAGQLHGLTHLTALKIDPIKGLIVPINKLLGFKPDTELLIYEELSPQKLEVLSVDTTFEKNELSNGDIICVAPVAIGGNYDIKSHYKFLYTRFHVQVSAFHPDQSEDVEYIQADKGNEDRNSKNSNEAAKLDFWISIQISYLEFATEIAKRINVDPTYLRIFAVNHHRNRFPLKRSTSLLQLLGKTVNANQITNFEYEILNIPLEQYEDMRLIKFNWLSSLVHYQTFEFLIPKKSLVEGDLVNKLLHKVHIASQDLPNLLIWSGVQHKYVDIIKFNREISTIPDNYELNGAILPAEVETLVSYDMVKRFEPTDLPVDFQQSCGEEHDKKQSDEDEKILQYELQQVKNYTRKLNMIPGFHFYKNSSYHHGIPFIFPVFPEEKLPKTKARLRAKMGLGVKEFDKIKFALADVNDKGKYLDSENDDFVLYDELKDHQDQLALALDHPDRSPKRLNIYDRGISIK